jgi:Methylamine utilisation protein MauE
MGLARIYLGVLLAAMAFGQVVSAGAFFDAIESYEVGGRGAAVAVAVAIIALEAGGAAGLLAGRFVRVRVTTGAWLALGAAVVWSALALQGLARGLDVDNCGCFGAYLSQPLTWWVVPQDAIFVALAAYVLVRARRPAGRRISPPAPA